MKLAFALLAHDDPDNLVRLVTRLTADGDLVVVHWDRKSKIDVKGPLEEKLPPDRLARVRFAKRHRVAWGQWSMVEATLSCLDEIAGCGESVDYVIHLSGADYPLQPLERLKAFLADSPGREYIESVDPNQTRWVVQGYNEERFLYRFYFNWKRYPRLFSWSVALQQFLGLRRRMPGGLQPRLGSQWWALTWETACEVLALSRDSCIRAFFRHTSVPDECFFHTLVASIVPDRRMAQRILTFYHFSSDGKPLVYYDDHARFLKDQPFFFARKISPHADGLRDALDEICAERASGSEHPVIDLKKDMTTYDRLVHLHRRSPPNRRVMASEHNTELGDLDWNRIPYFFLMDFGDLDLSDIRRTLNDTEGIRCYGELFARDAIGYDLPGEEHPGYPHDAPALRDHRPTTFMFDLLNLKPNDGIIGFLVSVDGPPNSFQPALRDLRALPIFVVPRVLFQKTPNSQADLRIFFRQRVVQDSLDISGFPAWRAPLVCVYEDRLSAADVDKIKKAILSWRNGESL